MTSAWSAPGPRDRVSEVGRSVGLRLCRAVLRVDAVPTEKIAEPLDLFAQGRQGCPLLLAGGLVAEQLPFLSRSTAAFSKSCASMAASLSRRTWAISRSRSPMPTRCSRTDKRHSMESRRPLRQTRAWPAPGCRASRPMISNGPPRPVLGCLDLKLRHPAQVRHAALAGRPRPCRSRCRQRAARSRLCGELVAEHWPSARRLGAGGLVLFLRPLTRNDTPEDRA